MARPRVNFQCQADGCNEAASAKGYCVSHYGRFYKYGNANVPLRHVGKHDLVGKAFGGLSVVAEAEPSDGHSQWLCRCSCGNEVVVAGGHLVSGDTKSCGCNCRKPRHGHAARTGRTPTYQVWQAMKRRCLQPNSKHYKDYGGRGISVCERWLTYENFLADMGKCPAGLTLERINNEGNYEPGNCKWATMVEQMNNQRKTIRLTYGGVTKSAGTWARERGMSRTTLTTRLNRGWSVERALNEPVHSK